MKTTARAVPPERHADGRLTQSALQVAAGRLTATMVLLASLTQFAFAQPVGLTGNVSVHGVDSTLQRNEPSRPHFLLFPAATVLMPELRLFAEPPRSPAASRASWWAPVASAVLPGSGQALLRQQRSLAYLVAEAFLILQASRVENDFRSARTRYRSIAADVARLPFGPDRPVGTWDYYETVGDVKWTSSGNYDLAVGGKFTPEPDEATYNGRQWLLARSLYWTSPSDRPAESSVEYQKAIAFYQAGAYTDNFRWSWRDNQNAKELYLQTIKEANTSNQRRVSMVGLVAANHLLSLVDSYVTVRLRRYGGAGLVSASIQSELRPSGLPGDNSIASAVKLSLPIPGSGRRP